MTQISDILEKIQTYSPDADLRPVMSAYLLAARAHAGQTRKSGEPYLSHPLAVAKILADMRMDTDTIATALLHDALEDNPITKAEMEAEIGAEITELVDGVTKIGKLRFRSSEDLAAENFRKMMLAMSRDLRVILVKLADRLHNIQTLEHHRPEKRIKIASETMDIFVPIANRLGLVRFKTELQDICFQFLHPDEHEAIAAFLAATHSDRQEYIDRVVVALSAKLEGELPFTIKGRAKHPYSIYKKMVAQGLTVEDVPDVIAFRVIVSNVSECYLVLGVIHGAFPPIPDRIKDYIARPKANGYQSLHTTVIGPEGRRIEVQIRTSEMDRIAEQGIAAHWRYKEGRLALSREDVARISRIRQLFDAASQTDDATDFMETLKFEFYSDEVFVFTPAGDVRPFRAGATALDFAFAVHTDVGLRCTGAKVDGRMVPLRYVLQSGDHVEILTAKHQKPTRDWLNIARTGRAIQKIRRFLREEERELGQRLGQDMVHAEIRRFGTTMARVRSAGGLKRALAELEQPDAETLFVEVARGRLPLGLAVRAMLPEDAEPTREGGGAPSLSNIFSRWRSRSESPVLISGEDGVLVNFAQCCHPLPGEQVVGFITRGRGITVHKQGCSQLKGLDAERQISVQWDPGASYPHSSDVEIVCTDRPGILANISKVCEMAKVNINRVEARQIGDARSLCTLELAVRHIDEMTRVIANLRKIQGVESVQRVSK